MKNAYLILCHKNPHQVNLLTKELCRDGSQVFLHWDKTNYRECVPQLTLQKNVTVIPYEESISVGWGEFSICEAQLTLCHYALKKQPDYVFNLSGQDFPLWSQQEIKKYLTQQNGTNFIDILNESSPYYKNFEKRNQLFHRKFLRKNTFGARCLRKIYYLLTGGMSYTFPFFRRKAPLPLYYGSNWWCLTGECLQELVSLYDSTPDLQKFFQGSICSDECLFQSLFMKSSYRNTNQSNLTYIDWSEHKASPKTFLSADKNVLLAQSEKCFARKFDIQKDEEILLTLQQRIHRDDTNI